MKLIFLATFFLLSSCSIFKQKSNVTSVVNVPELSVNARPQLPEGYLSSEFIAREIQLNNYIELKKKRQKIIGAASSATVLLKEVVPVSGTVGFGTGFFISPTRIVTNKHVLQAILRNNGPIVIESPTKRQYVVSSSVLISKIDDLAILDVVNTVSPYLELGESSTVFPGDLVYVQGNPKGARDISSSGYVSSKQYYDIYGNRNDRLMSITAPISPGSSGGPVMDEDGKVIGIVVSTVHDGQNLNYVIPVHCLRELLAEGNVLNSSVSATNVVSP